MSNNVEYRNNAAWDWICELIDGIGLVGGRIISLLKQFWCICEFVIVCIHLGFVFVSSELVSKY